MNEIQTTNDTPKLLTLKEACEILHCHPNTLRQWDKKGVLPAVRIGIKRLRRYKKESILRFMEKGTLKQ